MPVWAKPIGGKELPRPPAPNPRYTGISPAVDSGFNEIKQRRWLEETRAHLAWQRGEKFRRVKLSQLQQLMAAEGVEVLLLDVRDEEDFQQFRIDGAVSYPVRLMNRSVNAFTPEILDCANREPQRVIVLTDLDETVAAPAANLFYEKGFDNVFLLTGGTRNVIDKCVEMLEGPGLPALLTQLRSGRRRSSRPPSSQISSACSRIIGAPSVALSRSSFRASVSALGRSVTSSPVGTWR